MSLMPRMAAILLLGVLTGGCGSGKPLVPYTLETPPLVLLPISHVGVTDGRGRFREIYCAVQADHGAAFPNDRPCGDVVQTLLDEPPPTGLPVHLGNARLPLRVVVVPGLFNDCISHMTSAFRYARAHLETIGYPTSLLLVSGRSGSAYNARQIRNWLMEADLGPEEKAVLVGYSKGASDVLEALVSFPELQERVAAVVSVAGTLGGTALADGLGHLYSGLLKELHIEACPPGDGEAVESLKRSVRQRWLSQNRLPRSVRYFSVGGIVQPEDISSILRPFYDRLARVDPRNDSQVVFSDAVIPGSTLLGFVRADHWAIAVPFDRDMPLISPVFIDRNAFPREVLLESVMRFVEESLIADRR